MPDEKVIQVNGHGEVEAAPDIAVINLGVLSRESDAQAAMYAASVRMQAIVESVRSLGMPSRDIQTSQLNLHLDPHANVYLANHQVMVRTEDVSRAGPILDAGIEAGANASSGIEFSLADQSEAEDRALELAVADARRKAERLAAALGVAIDGVDRVSASGGSQMMAAVPRMQLFRSIHAPATPVPVEGGVLRIVADVQVTYTFRAVSR
jgi:uncharacterized protein YggE